MKRICNGCDLAAQKRGMFDCPFCRTPFQTMMLIAGNDSGTGRKEGSRGDLHPREKYFYGELGLQKDMRKAVELWTEAAELGSIEALYNLGVAYYHGKGFKRTRQRLPSSTKRRPCKDMLRAGTILAV